MPLADVIYKGQSSVEQGNVYAPYNPFTPDVEQTPEPEPPPKEIVAMWIEGVRNNDPLKDSYIELLKMLQPFPKIRNINE